MEYFNADNEMAYLGWHLKKKLFRSKDYDFTALTSSFAQLIDANYPALRGYQPQTKAAEKIYPSWSNPKFQRLEEQVKAAGDVGFTDALFFLYDLAGKGADDLIEWIEKTKTRCQMDGKIKSLSMSFDNGKAGITFVTQKNNIRTLGQNLLDYSIARKHRTKADMWLGLASMADSSNIVDAIVFNKTPWEFDDNNEALANTLLKKGATIGANGKKLGRNDPCYCGSGKKFKKCCGA